MLYKNDVLKNFAKLTGSTCAKIYVNIIKNRLHHPHVFLWICEVFKNNFYEGYLRAAFPAKLEYEHPITLKKQKNLVTFLCQKVTLQWYRKGNFWLAVSFMTLRKTSQFYLISWCRNCTCQQNFHNRKRSENKFFYIQCEWQNCVKEAASCGGDNTLVSPSYKEIKKLL